jgi:hypothetical protein
LHFRLETAVRISRLADVDAQFREQKSLVDAFARRLERMPYSDQAGHAKLFSDVLLAARTNTSLGRLYAAASDLQCADALRSHVEYLDRVNEEWVLTDVESEEREQASSYLSVCMRDASTQLGLNARTPQGRLCDEITVIFDKTREPSKTRPYVSCWEGWKIDSP